MKAGIVLVGVMLTAAAAHAAEPRHPPKTYRLEWRDLAPMITGHRVALALPGGPRVGGKVLAVEPDQLRLDITRTSDKRILPKGPARIPRASISELRLTKGLGYQWRVIGTVIGGVLGGAIGGAIAIANPGAGLAFFAGSTGLGFWGGWASDRKVAHIAIIPETAERACPPPCPMLEIKRDGNAEPSVRGVAGVVGRHHGGGTEAGDGAGVQPLHPDEGSAPGGAIQ